MWIAILVYFFVSFACIYFLEKNQEHFSRFPRLKATKNGISFYSNKRHRIKIFNSKVFQLDSCVYLSKNNIQICLSNVDKIMLQNDYLYFNAMGAVKIDFKFSEFRFFAIEIKAQSFNFGREKQIALNDVLKNIFDYQKQKKFIRFLRIMKEVFNINFCENKLILKRNAYNLKYELRYRVGGVVKHLIVNKDK